MRDLNLPRNLTLTMVLSIAQWPELKLPPSFKQTARKSTGLTQLLLAPNTRQPYKTDKYVMYVHDAGGDSGDGGQGAHGSI